MLITNGRMVQTGTRRRTIHRQVNLGPISMRLVTIVVLAAVVLIGLIQTTQSATKNYKVGELAADVAKKEKDVEGRRFEKARLEAISQYAKTEATPSPSPALETPAEINSLITSPNNNLSQLTTSTNVQ